jgi:hypothetical protein
MQKKISQTKNIVSKKALNNFIVETGDPTKHKRDFKESNEHAT